MKCTKGQSTQEKLPKDSTLVQPKATKTYPKPKAKRPHQSLFKMISAFYKMGHTLKTSIKRNYTFKLFKSHQ